MGRPRKRLLPEHYPLIEKWASCGVSERSIAREIGIGETTWKQIKKRDPRARECLERGRAREHDTLVGSLFKTAMDRDHPKHATACIFLLKARHGYIDQPKPEVPQNRIELTFQLPKPLSEEQYQQLVDVTPPKALAAAGVEVPPDA